MPITNRRAFCMLFAYHLRAANNNRNIAVSVLIDNNVPNPKAYAFNTGLTENDTRTAIVNLLQGTSENNIPKGSEIYTTETPTVACLGIAKAQGVKNIYYVDNGQLCYIDMSPNRVPTVQNHQVVNLGQNPPKAERLNPGLPDPVEDWLVADKNVASAAATAWYTTHFEARKREPPKKEQTSLKALNYTADVLGTYSTGVPWLKEFRLAVPTAAVPGASADFRDRIFMSLVRVIAARGWQHEAGGPNLRQALLKPRIKAGKNIAAVLVNANNQILGWGLNTNDESTSRHAETNAIQSYQAGQGTALPNGTRIYSTLDPCFMCAALFLRAGGEHCLYEQADTNMTGNTALGDTSVQYHETYTGRVTLSESTRTPVLSEQVSVGQQLDADREKSGKRAVDFLKTGPALEVYSHAHERLATTGLRAASVPDRQLYNEVMEFLRKNAYLGAIGRNDALLPDDDMRPILPKTVNL